MTGGTGRWFPAGKDYGYGCKVRGLKSCLDQRTPNAAIEFWERAARKQIPDSVRLMRTLVFPPNPFSFATSASLAPSTIQGRTLVDEKVT